MIVKIDNNSNKNKKIRKKNIYIYYKEVTLPQFLQNYKETKTKF